MRIISRTRSLSKNLGCFHYKRNVKMQCYECERWYTCRLCHDEARKPCPYREDIRKNMLCMLCNTPQRASHICRMCGQLAARYYCAICKLWSDDPDKAIYHCDDCGICRLGEGLGKDFFHCKTCAACMSISAEPTHKCIEKSTQCDCPICGEYLFTSNKSVAFMRCGHAIHEICFADWCKSGYKCPRVFQERDEHGGLSFDVWNRHYRGAADASRIQPDSSVRFLQRLLVTVYHIVSLAWPEVSTMRFI